MRQNNSAAPSIEAPTAFASIADRLDARAPRLGNVVRNTSRRRDARELRAQILYLLLEGGRYCPPEGVKRRPWYVLGAVARSGVEWIYRAWKGFYGENPPTIRCLQGHLGVLERAAALIRAPGDWQPVLRDPEHPERRPRYPNTLHVLESDVDADWWEREGQYLLERFPETRCNPDAWRRVFARWRERAARAPIEPTFDFEAQASPIDQGGPELEQAPEPQRPVHPRSLGRREPTSADVAGGRELAAAARMLERDPMRLLERLAELRIHVRGLPLQLRFQREPARFAGAVRLLARAKARGDIVRNAAGWIVRAFNFAPELQPNRKRTWPKTSNRQ